MARDFLRIFKGINFAGQASAPSSPANGDVYYDTTLQKLRCYQNGAWVNLSDSDGTVLLADGSVSNPSLAFIDDTDTGIFRPSGSDLAITANGSQVASFQPTRVSIAVPLQLALTASRAVYLDSNQRFVASPTTDVELGYLSGVTSAIQTQLNLKAPLASPTFTGNFSVQGNGSNTGFNVNTSNAITIGASGGTETHIINGLMLDQTVSSATISQQNVTNTGSGGSLQQVFAQNALGRAIMRLIAGNATAGSKEAYIHYRLRDLTPSNWFVGAYQTNNFHFRYGASDDVTLSTLYGSISTTGTWTLGASGGTQTHTVNGALDVTVDNTTLDYGTDGSGNPILQFDLVAGKGASIYTNQANASMILSGGNATNNGANIQLFGGSHSTPSIMNFRIGSTTAGSINASSAFTIGASGGTQTHTINGAISVTGASGASATLTGDIEHTDAGNAFFRTISTGTGGTAQYRLQTKATDGGDTYLQFVPRGLVQFAVGVIAGEDSLKFYAQSFGSGSLRGSISQAGVWTLGSASGTQTHIINGSSSQTRFQALARFDVASAATIAALDSTRSFVKLTGSTATTIQGITAGIDGQRLTVVNLTGQNMTVSNENGSASAANRITTMTGADVVTTANGAAEFVYDTDSSRWICLYVTA